MASLGLSGFLLTADNLMISTAVPQIVIGTGATGFAIHAIVSGYLYAYASLLILAGALGDRYGRNTIVRAGLVALAFASSVASVTDTAGIIVACRVIMGAGAALIMPNVLASLVTVFDQAGRRAAVNMYSTATTVGFVLAPLLGGLVVEIGTWRSVFLINLPVAALLFLATCGRQPLRDGSPSGFNAAPAVSSVLVLASLAVLVDMLTARPPTGWLVVGIVLFVSSTMWFLQSEYHSTNALAPWNLLTNRVFAGTSLIVCICQFSYAATIFVLAQYFQVVVELSPTQAGAALLPLAAGVWGATLVGKHTLRRWPATATLTAGMCVLVTAFAWLAVQAEVANFGYVTVAVLIVGVGAGLTKPATTLLQVELIPAARASGGLAVSSTMSQFAAATGVAVTGALLTSAPTGAAHAIEFAREVGTVYVLTSSVAACGLFMSVALYIIQLRSNAPTDIGIGHG